MEGELIFLGFIMLIGQVILLEMYQHNWFKKETFKFKQKFDTKQMNLQFKKLERELGFQPSRETKEPATMIEKIGGIADILKNADPDTLKELANKFLTRDEETEYEEVEDEDLAGTILKYVDEDTIKGFIEGLGTKTEGKTKSANY